MDIQLSKNEGFSLETDGREVVIACTSGVLWVTFERDTRDHLLYPGQRVVARDKGLAVVEARRESDLRVERTEVGAGSTFCAALLHPLKT